MSTNRERDIERGRGHLRRILGWLGCLSGTLLTLIVIATLLEPHLMERLILGPTPTPLLTPTPRSPKAAILDQTSRTDPSPDFIEKARDYLSQAGYEVDVYTWEKLTVDFYRTLPIRGHRLILFQTHSTSEAIATSGTDRPPTPFIFTGEEASRRYLVEQLRDRIRPAKFFYGDFPQFFAIGPEFVRLSMSGLFSGTIIIIGGCQSLATPDLAQAFLDRGASVVIGWGGLVDLSHNNRAILHLLQALIVEGRPPQSAVEETMEAIGPDPTYGSVLSHVP